MLAIISRCEVATAYHGLFFVQVVLVRMLADAGISIVLFRLKRSQGKQKADKWVLI